jgi:hypothetical protein
VQTVQNTSSLKNDINSHTPELNVPSNSTNPHFRSSIEGTAPDYDIEQFWLGFKQSMTNFYEMNKIIARPLADWSAKLNKYQLLRQYDKIEQSIMNYITLYGIDVIRLNNSYYMGILMSNLKRWDKIAKKYRFTGCPVAQAKGTAKDQLIIHPEGVRLGDFRSSIGVPIYRTPHGTATDQLIEPRSFSLSDKANIDPVEKNIVIVILEIIHSLNRHTAKSQLGDFRSSLGMCHTPGLDKSAPHGTAAPAYLFNDIELYLIYEDFSQLIEYAVEQNKPCILDKLTSYDYLNVCRTITQLYGIELNGSYKLNSKKLLKRIKDINPANLQYLQANNQSESNNTAQSPEPGACPDP